MGRFLFRLPDVGEGVAEAEIVAWHVKPGDRIQEDQSLVDVMTDKATVDMTSPVDGLVIALHGDVGAMLPVGAVLVELEVAGVGEGDIAPSEPSPPSEPSSEPPPEPSPPARAPDAAARVPLAAPATRRRAREAGVDLHAVPGTGPGGRIRRGDLEAFVAAREAPPAGGERRLARSGVHETRILGLRRKIAEKMQEAKRSIPHITYVDECDLTELEALRADLNAHGGGDQPKLTLLPFLMRALVKAVAGYPQVNARYDDKAGVLHRYDGVHIGIATQTAGGLMVPVVRHAEARDLWDCARELARVTGAARDGSAAREELSGSTITITSLGPLGGIATTPVINHPEVAIIGPNKLVDRPVVQGGFVTVRKIMNLSSSFDHRIVDGHDAASFIQQLRRLLEHPALIFMD